MQLVAARRRATDPDVAAALDGLLAGTADEIRKLRTLVTELRPAALDELGLGPAVQSLARDVAAATGLRVDVAVDLEGAAGPDGRLAPDRETAVYRLAQEALTNVVKHADARAAAVTVTNDGSAIVLAVRDDGRGIDAAAVARREGFGITGMRERVRLEAGTLRIAPRAGG
ncbi:sensor histidine kinase, partial [Patulibacter sp. S7RM1-6]